MKYQNVVIIHGVGGLHRESYFEHLSEYCKSLGLNVIMPSFGGYKDDITYKIWEAKADVEVLPYLGLQTIVVAQSMGTNFVVKYLAAKRQKVGAYISVAGSSRFEQTKAEHPSKDKIVSIFKDFKPSMTEYTYLKQFTCSKFSFFSDTDNFTQLRELREYSSFIGSQPILLKGKGHFDCAAGVTKFDELETLITKITGL